MNGAEARHYAATQLIAAVEACKNNQDTNMLGVAERWAHVIVALGVIAR